MFERVEKFIFFALVFSTPFQARVFLWSANLVEGFNEWQSIFFYGTDILIFALLFLQAIRLRWLKGVKEEVRNKFSIFNFQFSIFIVLLIGSGVVSLFFADYLSISIYRLIKLILFIWLFYYVLHNKEKLGLQNIFLVLVGSAVFQGILAILQFLFQRSLGLWFLGEVTVKAGMDGAAHILTFGERFLRAYGTFTNPNVLAAFLSIVILVLINFYLIQKGASKNAKLFVILSLPLLILALIFTFSRAVILVFIFCIILYAIILLFFTKFKEYRKSFLYILSILFFTMVIFSTIFWPEVFGRFIVSTFSYKDPAIGERMFLNDIALDMIEENKLGVGLGNFTLQFRDIAPGLQNRLYQPVHNIFLLYTAETGIFGGAVFTIFILTILFLNIRKGIKNQNSILFIVLPVFILLTGMFDHFYLTLQQGSLMFWTLLALTLRPKEINEAESPDGTY